MSVDEPNVASPILVTGATGRHGGTGRAVARSLISKGFRVRALVRQRDRRAEAVAAEGAEVVVGDYANYGSLLDALDGVRSGYSAIPSVRASPKPRACLRPPARNVACGASWISPCGPRALTARPLRDEHNGSRRRFSSGPDSMASAVLIEKRRNEVATNWVKRP
jgi:NAD(P)-dependent dehydrogenase (short-subunit alcohol dehydrogenase family)